MQVYLCWIVRIQFSPTISTSQLSKPQFPSLFNPPAPSLMTPSHVQLRRNRDWRRSLALLEPRAGSSCESILGKRERQGSLPAPSPQTRSPSGRWYLDSGQLPWPPLGSTGAAIATLSILISTPRDSLPNAFPGEGKSRGWVAPGVALDTGVPHSN